MKLYNNLENTVRKYVVKPLVIGSIVGILGYGNLAHANRSYNNDILVNTCTEGWQGEADITINENGNIVITWGSYFQNSVLHDGDVFAQRFDGEMNKRGEEFQVNPTKGYCTENCTAIDKEGNFIVAWVNSSDWRVYAQRFGSEGNRIGNEFRVSPTESEQRYPHIVMDGEGNFLVALRYGAYGPAYAQRFDRNGDRIGEEFGIGGYESRIAMDPNGNFITTDAGYESLGASKYDWNGNLIYSVLVSLSKAGGADSVIGQSSVALNDTESIVTWEDYDGGSSIGIYARRFDKDGNSVGDEFRVNRSTENNQLCPDVAMTTEGEYIILWMNLDGFVADVFAQRFNRDGNKIGEEFRVNNDTRVLQGHVYPRNYRIAMSDSNYFIVVWGGKGEEDDQGVYAKKFSFYNPADLNKDGYVGFKDYAIFTDNWLAYGP